MRLLVLLLPAVLVAETVSLPEIQKPVEILRDRWGVPHIYASTVDDLFFAQGYLAARDRLFQIDLWRRIGTGHLSEVLGAEYLDRDTVARAVRYRGDMRKEWESYGPGTQRIVTAFTRGINAYIRSLGGKRPPDFERAQYDPAMWAPEDCLARVAGLLMTRNLTNEVQRMLNVRTYGLKTVERLQPPDPFVGLKLPNGLKPSEIAARVLDVYRESIGAVRFGDSWEPDAGSNNWVVDGTRTESGKPLLANDPHRPIQIPSLRKTVHLVGPGWNAFGAGEPALPGIALGHNERIGFGFTIVGIDQQDLYVERLDPNDHSRYLYRGKWKTMQTERQLIHVRDSQPVAVTLRYTIHGPVLYEDAPAHRAYVIRWVGTEPGAAGYLAGLSLARAGNWQEFLQAVARYKVPSENLVYADVDGNIGWTASGLTPIRPNWSGLLPVPGHSGEYEWAGFRAPSDLPQLYNPESHTIATANHNILPPGYTIPLGYEWAPPFRFQRIEEMLEPSSKFTVADFERMQQDVQSIPARRFQQLIRDVMLPPAAGRPQALLREFLAWDGRLSMDSRPALLFELWLPIASSEVFGRQAGLVGLPVLLRELEARKPATALQKSFQSAIRALEAYEKRGEGRWGAIHKAEFRHPLGDPLLSRGPVSRPGDGNTVNATGSGIIQTSGASYRQILDLSDWDKSVMTNVPGESGDPRSPHYADLLKEWAEGRYHPMLYTRKAVEANTVERITLKPR